MRWVSLRSVSTLSRLGVEGRVKQWWVEVTPLETNGGHNSGDGVVWAIRANRGVTWSLSNSTTTSVSSTPPLITRLLNAILTSVLIFIVDHYSLSLIHESLETHFLTQLDATLSKPFDKHWFRYICSSVKTLDVKLNRRLSCFKFTLNCDCFCWTTTAFGPKA